MTDIYQADCLQDTIVDSIIFTVPKGDDTGVRISINGRDLIEIVREIELPFAAREGSSGIAGAYTGIPSDVAFLPSRHFLGEPDPDHSVWDERPYIFICECGEPGCCPLLVRIKLRKARWYGAIFASRTAVPTQWLENGVTTPFGPLRLIGRAANRRCQHGSGRLDRSRQLSGWSSK